MPNSKTRWGSWVLVDPMNRNEYNLVLEDRLEGETAFEEAQRVVKLLGIHQGLMDGLSFTGAIHVCRACAELN